MPFGLGRIVVAAMLPVLMLLATHGFAQEKAVPASPDEAQILERLLVAGWARTSPNRRELKVWYDELPAERKTPVVEWAYALNRLNLNQYREARPSVDRLANVAPLNWDIRVAQIWLQVFYGEYSQACEAMLALQQDLNDHPDESEAAEFEVYQRLGRLVGFLSGPLGEKTAATGEPARTLELLQQRAKPDLWRALEAEQHVVADLYAGFRADQQDEQQRLADEAQRRQGVELDQQLEVAAQLQAQLDRGRDEREAVIDQGNTATSDRQSQVAALQEQYSQLTAGVSALRLEAANYGLSATQLQAAAAQEKDPALRTQLALQANNYAVLARDRQIAADNRQLNANNVAQRFQAAQAELEQTRGQYASRVAELEQRIAELDRASRDAGKKIRNLQAAPKTTNARLAVLGTTAQALTTYSPFPADRFKRRLMESWNDE